MGESGTWFAASFGSVFGSSIGSLLAGLAESLGRADATAQPDQREQRRGGRAMRGCAGIMRAGADFAREPSEKIVGVGRRGIHGRTQRRQCRTLVRQAFASR